MCARLLMLVHTIDCLPEKMACARDARDLVSLCCNGQLGVPLNPCLADPLASTEFINAISSEAQEICDKDSKKTMSPDHVVEALKVNTPRGFPFMPADLVGAGARL